MEKRIALVFFFFFFFTVIASTGKKDDCIDCTVRSTHFSVGGGSLGGLQKTSLGLSQKTASRKLPKRVVDDLCEAIENNSFRGGKRVLSDEGLKLEDVYTQVSCKRSIPTLMHFIIKNPTGYRAGTFAILKYFDEVKKKNPGFDYGEVLNMIYKGRVRETTILDRVIKKIPSRTGNDKSILMTFKKHLIKRGGLTAVQVKSQNKLVQMSK